VANGTTAVVIAEGHSHSHGNKAEAFSPPQLNFRGVFLHVLADALGSVVVIVSALIVQFAKTWSLAVYVDPTLSIVLVVIIVCSTVPLLLMSANVLLQSVPDHLALDDMKERLVREFPAIINVHEFHVWQLVATRIVASVHVQLSEETQHSLEEHMRLVKQMKGFFHREGIHSTTIQMEYSSRHMTPANDACVVQCPPLGLTTISRLGRSDCSEDQCCGLRSSRRRRTNSTNGSVRSSGSQRQRTASSSTSVSMDSRGGAFDRSHSVCSVPSVTVVTPTM
jgi:zinc transporter 1